MILVDTSVWVDHLRHGDSRLAERLEDRRLNAAALALGLAHAETAPH